MWGCARNGFGFAAASFDGRCDEWPWQFEMPMASNDAEPIHRVKVDGFFMDKTAVTKRTVREIR